MKIAFTYNLRLTDAEEEAEFDTAETVDAIATAVEAAGHDVERIEVSGPASNLLARLEASDPDIVFNTAEGGRGRMREAFYPSLFEELGIPYTGSDAYTLTVTLDKWLTKLVLARHGIDTPSSRLLTAETINMVLETGIGLAYPVIVKPNYEGSSKGIAADSVARDPRELAPLLRSAMRAYPDGVLVEEFVPGIDLSVGYIAGVGHDGGLLMPVEYVVEPAARNKFNLYDYRLKNLESDRVQVRCPAAIPRDVAARLRAISQSVFRCLDVRDLGRIDFRYGDDGRIYVLEVNALPGLHRGSSLFAATSQLGLSYDASVQAVLNAAALRAKVATAEELGVRRRSRPNAIRVGFTYNVKRPEPKTEKPPVERRADEHDDQLAEWDPPETIIAIANALARQGHIVVHLEATADLPRVLAEADVDLIFNIAEGVEGRNREAQVPALCELLGIPYTGSDSATLAVALDKALCKKVLMQHDILTPNFQVMETGREKLEQDLTFPLIVKPIAEGSSKGIGATSVVDSEAELRASVKNIVERYRQPALVEEYIHGREFTVGLLGDKRPRVLPPMEILFRDTSVARPVYDYKVKQEWEKHVYYECPAKLTPAELKAIEKIARATFWAVDCRDVARVDLRMAADGRIYVLEVNPLPGLTPGYSDLVLIATAAGMDYDQLIAEVMMGGLRRLKEKRRVEREALGRAEASQKLATTTSEPESRGNGNGNGGGSSNGSGNGNGGATHGGERADGETVTKTADAVAKIEQAAEKAEKAAEKAEKAAKKMVSLARRRPDTPVLGSPLLGKTGAAAATESTTPAGGVPVVVAKPLH